MFKDRKYDLLAIRHQAVQVLAARKSTRLVPPTLEFLNSVVDSDSDIDFETEHTLRGFVGLLGQIYTQETYQGLTKFLNRLLTENPKHKDLFLTNSVFSLMWVGFKLNIGDSVSVLRMAIPHLQVGQGEHQALKNLARHFDIFNEPEGIKEILTNHVTSEASGMEDVEARCLELLQKHDPEFVDRMASKQKQQRTAHSPRFRHLNPVNPDSDNSIRDSDNSIKNQALVKLVNFRTREPAQLLASSI